MPRLEKSHHHKNLGVSQAQESIHCFINKIQLNKHSFK